MRHHTQTMITFTREQLIEHAQKHIAHGAWLKENFPDAHKTPATVDLARIALAAMQQEPVAWDYEWASCITCEGPQDFRRIIEREAPPEWAIDEGQARNITPLYRHAQPAPVVPPERPADSSNGDDVEAWFDEEWNACRAAMLNGGDRG
ncbi:hypothetical protein [Erwinia sp. HR93]|uniref:hypothetical protein n=1 Tax=Erwinia sp. HR93 TaxID=3094840 RepID=UPI002ADED21C|nr:hypothetical protein [Erwinia sp. HR93]MEA1064702.1 hypothetical protein [Erwinia sp. HR93]